MRRDARATAGSPGTSRMRRSAEIRRQLEYKTAWHGGRLIVADRWFASSKTCSGCGAVKAKLALSERTYLCTVAAWSWTGT